MAILVTGGAGFIGSHTAVSYTHLDVYKRQGKSMARKKKTVLERNADDHQLQHRRIF